MAGVLKFILAHELELISLVDKDGLICADIMSPRKLEGIPELSTLHEFLLRIAKFANAGRSISSGGGSKAGGFRVSKFTLLLGIFYLTWVVTRGTGLTRRPPATSTAGVCLEIFLGTPRSNEQAHVREVGAPSDFQHQDREKVLGRSKSVHVFFTGCAREGVRMCVCACMRAGA